MVELNERERLSLLGLARAAIREAIEHDDALTQLLERTEITSPLERPRGAFVSLKLPRPAGQRDALRGCIGNIAASTPLYRNVIELAPKAALADPRFPPLTGVELDVIRIEVSALTSPTPLTRPEDLVVGRDGVRMSKGRAQAIFLPQVATENAWSRERLLEQLALKAGLAEGDWKGAELSVFQAEVFREAA